MGEYIQDFYRIIGSMFCHQLHERTLIVDSFFMPVCARDAGIYSGVFISLFYAAVMRRLKADKPPDLTKALVLCSMMIPMMADGATSYIGFRDTSNIIRFLTGIFFGMAIPLFLIPAANYRVDYENKIPILKSWREVLILVASNGLFSLLVLKTNVINWYVISTIVIFGFLFIITRLVFTVITRVNGKKPKLYTVIGFSLGVFILMFVVSRFFIKLRNILL